MLICLSYLVNFDITLMWHVQKACSQMCGQTADPLVASVLQAVHLISPQHGAPGCTSELWPGALYCSSSYSYPWASLATALASSLNPEPSPAHELALTPTHWPSPGSAPTPNHWPILVLQN